MISAGVLSILRSGMVTSGPMTITISEATNIIVRHVPIDRERESRWRAPKYWDTMIPVPTEMPMNSTSRRLSTGLALPTAASALSPMYLPTTMLSTVLYSC